MNIATASDSANFLYCELCDYIQFSCYAEFHNHHLGHICQPLVRLVKLSSKLTAKLQWKSYKINTGVARRSLKFEHVPPLKITVVKQQGLKHFQVIKEKDKYRSYNSSVSELESQEESTNKKPPTENKCGILEVEGNNLLQRLGANISISRKGQSPPQVCSESTVENVETNCILQKESEVDIKGFLLGRLSGIEGISISKTIPSTNGNSDFKQLSEVSVSSKQKSIDLVQLKKLKEYDSESDKKVADKNKLLERLSGSGLISIASKSLNKLESERLNEKDHLAEEKIKGDGKAGFSEKVENSACTKSVRSKSVDHNDSSNMKSSSNNSLCQVKNGDHDKGKVFNENNSENCEQKRFVRIKNSTYSKKNSGFEKQNSLDETTTEEKSETSEENRDADDVPKETGIDILERLTKNLSNTVGRKKSGSQSDSKDIGKETKNGFNNEALSQDEEQACTLLLTPPSSSGQDGENSNYSTISSHQNESFVESNNVSEENNEVSENDAAFSSLTSESQKESHGDDQNSFWSNIRGVSNNVDQSQQGSLMVSESSASNGESMNSSFLHNFLNEHQQSSSISQENSEFMSLDRLAQTQHQQPPFDLSNNDSNSPMEQLSQQVQRIPNLPPQINVISQHHMQAPQTPQLHTGVPLSPQHISPQQPSSYDSLSHMQPPMPPPLYPGFNIYNQNYSQQTPQQLPRPPMLQQRPQVQARSFQSLAAPRQRSRAPKRNVVRLPPSHEMTPPKQPRRQDPPLQARPQIQNPTVKVPSGITVTHPKNAVEANKVANVLASRGITVTPAVSRQTNQGTRPQSAPKAGQSPVLNIGSGISITSSSQSKTSGGFAMPGPRRNSLIVNHHVERPERCTTVDLTQDDEPPQMSRNRMSVGRFPCKQCGKIFTSSVALESHKASHRVLPFKCDKCTAQYPTSVHLQQHKLTSHKAKQSAPDLAIPIIDLNHPGAREQLLKCGIYSFIPLSQLQSNNNGYFGVPIVQLDTTKEKAVSNLNTLGAGNIFILGKMKALAPQPNQ